MMDGYTCVCPSLEVFFITGRVVFSFSQDVLERYTYVRYKSRCIYTLYAI